MKGKLLTSKRISIGPAKLLDAKDLAQYFNETKDLLGANTGEDMTVQKEKNFIKDMNKDPEKFFFVIKILETQQVIGSISISRIRKDDQYAVTGTMIGESFTNKGYGAEAKHLLLDFAFNDLYLRKLYSYVYSYNERSAAYSLKCGYRKIATLSEKKFYKGIYWDEWIFEITNEDWIPKIVEYKQKHGII
jgi:RimJ/RimL family protein N-acetyltransferase